MEADLQGQAGLSLSLSGYCFQGVGASSNTNTYARLMELHSGNNPLNPDGNLQVTYSYVESTTSPNVLRNSRYLSAAQELLEELCCVSRGQLKSKKVINQDANPNSVSNNLPLSPAQRADCHRRKIKLLSMLHQIHAILFTNGGNGKVVGVTGVARKAMSRHFRCMKDAILRELKASCQRLGENGFGYTTPTLIPPAAHSWRPQRGFSLHILTSCLFHHFLHPYPSEADKHLLSGQTGLSKNQVSNWFINARVRLWKPMVEEMYQQEFQENVQPSSTGAVSESSEINAELHGKQATSFEEEFGLVGGNEVSLTLGLKRHSENVPIMSQLSITDFEAYSYMKIKTMGHN